MELSDEEQQAIESNLDLCLYWFNVDVFSHGRKGKRKARFLRKYRRFLDRASYPCLFLNSRRLKERPRKDYDIDQKRSIRRQFTLR